MMSTNDVNTRRRGFERRNLFGKKVEKSDMALQLSDYSNTKIHTEGWTPPFKCDDCEFEGLSYKRLNTHKGKQQHIGAQAEA